MLGIHSNHLSGCRFAVHECNRQLTAVGDDVIIGRDIGIGVILRDDDPRAGGGGLLVLALAKDAPILLNGHIGHLDNGRHDISGNRSYVRRPSIRHHCL